MSDSDRRQIRGFPYSIHATSEVFYCAYKCWGHGMYTQRKNERRCFGGKTLFPLIAKGGYLVEKDRRGIPDRRLGNIHLELVDAVDHSLPEYLTNTSLYPSGKDDY
jgi:hypothetical protein